MILTREQLANATRLLQGSDQTYHKLRGCPSCEGRGWFALDPFGLPYPKNIVACPTCERSKRYFDLHGVLPQDVQDAIDSARKP